MSDFKVTLGSIELPLTPYAGTSGWSGSETSLERAVTEDSNGTTKKRQQQVLFYLERYKDRGVTWKELSVITNWHHGSSSGALSVLHKTGLIARLKQTRDRCAIYVLPEYVNQRETAQPKIKRCRHCGGVQ